MPIYNFLTVFFFFFFISNECDCFKMLKDSKYKLFLRMVKMALFGGMIGNFSMIHCTKYDIYNQYILPPD